MARRVEHVAVDLNSGIVLTGRSLSRPLIYRPNATTIITEASQFGNETYALPNLNIKSKKDQLYLTGDYTEMGIMSVAAADPQNYVGDNLDAVAFGTASDSVNADIVQDHISFNIMLIALWQRNGDGTIKIDPNTRAPMPARDALGQRMIGPLLLSWNQSALKVKNAAVAVPNELGVETPANLQVGGQDVTIGAWVAAGGGGGGNGCYASINEWGAHFE